MNCGHGGLCARVKIAVVSCYAMLNISAIVLARKYLLRSSTWPLNMVNGKVV